jgi:hypothetical protein
MPRHLAAIATCAVLCAGATAASTGEGFASVTDRSDFLSLVQNRELTRMGITLDVRPDGSIAGRAFGREVTGAWSWQDGFFCRDLAWGNRTFPYNCQKVERAGSDLRFTSDRGTGQSATLSLR